MGERLYTESFIGRLGDELLKKEALTSLVEAKVLVEEVRSRTAICSFCTHCKTWKSKPVV